MLSFSDELFAKILIVLVEFIEPWHQENFWVHVIMLLPVMNLKQ